MATKIANIQGPTGSKGPTGSPGLTHLSTDPGNQARLGTDAKILVTPVIPPLASPSANGSLTQLSGLTTDYVTGQNATADLATAITPTITDVRLRAYNAIGNPNFECNNRSIGTVTSTGGWACDRWQYWAPGGVGTHHSTTLVSSLTPVPGTTYNITGSYFRVTSTGGAYTPAAAEGYALYQTIEGPYLRELWYDVSSLSILARTSLPGTYCVALRDPGATYSISFPFTLSSYMTWTLVQIPNIPAFNSSAGGTFSLLSGNAGYQLLITPAIGANLVAPSNGVWLSGNYYGVAGQTNLFSGLGNNEFDVAYVQHEPGPVCTSLIDLPFDKNLIACKRYYQKSMGYATAVPSGITTTNAYRFHGVVIATSTVRLMNDWPVTMAKSPTVVLYGFNSTGANLTYTDATPAGNTTVNAPTRDARGFQHVTTPANVWTAGMPGPALGEWVADTGW